MTTLNTYKKIVNGIVVNMSSEEIAERQAEEKAWDDTANDRILASLRTLRNTLLAESDWTQVSDAPLNEEKKNEWAVYRQALRDLTQTNDLSNITWPEKPE